MSHFTVTACLDPKIVSELGIVHALNAILAPYDENKDVEPYRVYEEGSPSDHWFVSSMRRGAESFRALQELGPCELVRRRLENKVVNWREDTMEKGIAAIEQSGEWEEDASYDTKLGDNPTWKDVVELQNERYYSSALSLYPPDNNSENDSDRLYYDEELDRAYTMSTYNPDSKWDWWLIGGRWQRSLVSISDADPHLLIHGVPGVFGDNDNPYLDSDNRIFCDGGPVELLDFHTIRENEATRQLERYDTWQSIVAQHGSPPAWQHLRSLVEVGEMEIDDARRLYNEHPAIVAAGKAEIYSFMSRSPEEEFGLNRDEFADNARRDAVPGWALITLDGKWAEAGKMGFWAISDATEDSTRNYKEFANRYLESLPKDTIIVMLDCHI